jgi:hypothetical protein
VPAKVSQPALPLEPEPAGGVCEACGDPAPVFTARYGGAGLRCCAACVGLDGAGLAAAYGRRLRRITER